MEDPNAATEATNALCIAFLVMGLVIGIAAFLQTHLFNMAGVYLTTRIRSLTLGAMVQQDASWYDDPKNAVGALSVRLTSDASSVQGVSRTTTVLKGIRVILNLYVCRLLDIRLVALYSLLPHLSLELQFLLSIFGKWHW